MEGRLWCREVVISHAHGVRGRLCALAYPACPRNLLERIFLIQPSCFHQLAYFGSDALQLLPEKHPPETGANSSVSPQRSRSASVLPTPPRAETPRAAWSIRGLRRPGCTGPKIAATSSKRVEDAMRCLVEDQECRSGRRSCAAIRAWMRRWPSLAGRNPRKMKDSPANPLAISALMGQRSPGTGNTRYPRCDGGQRRSGRRDRRCRACPRR